jgi:hypothetical protein
MVRSAWLPLATGLLLAASASAAVPADEVHDGGDGIVHPHDVVVHVGKAVHSHAMTRFAQNGTHAIDPAGGNAGLRRRGARRKMDERDAFAIMLLLVVALVGSQSLLYWWKKNHYRSFQATTLFGLWAVPVVISVRLGFSRFLCLSGAYSLLASTAIWRATRRPLAKSTPRFVYRLFFGLYRACYAVGVLGYVLVMLDIFGVNRMATVAIHGPQALPKRVSVRDADTGRVRWKQEIPKEMILFGPAGILLLYYGFYFGVVSRDLAELLTGSVAKTLGYGDGSIEGFEGKAGGRAAGSKSKPKGGGGAGSDDDGGAEDCPKARPAQRADRWRPVPENRCSLCDRSLRACEAQGELQPVEAPPDARARAAAGGKLELVPLGGAASTALIERDAGLYIARARDARRARAAYLRTVDEQRSNAAVMNVEEKLCRLPCKHEFHEYCLRGWVIVGKRDTCPICGEKVELGKAVGLTPWESRSLLWGNLLDAVRYLVVWNPVIIAATQLLVYALHLGPPAEAAGAAPVGSE